MKYDTIWYENIYRYAEDNSKSMKGYNPDKESS